MLRENLEEMLEEKNIEYKFRQLNGEEKLLVFPQGKDVALVYKMEEFESETELVECIESNVQQHEEKLQIVRDVRDYKPDIQKKLYLCLSHTPKEISGKLFDFYVYVRCFQGDISIEVNKTLLDVWKISKASLFALAIENTEKLDMEFVLLYKEMYEMALEKGDFDLLLSMLVKPSEKVPLYLFRYKTQQHGCGASVILNHHLLKSIREKLGVDFYILPCSVEELLVLPEETKNEEMDEIEKLEVIEGLKKMVKEVNDDKLDEELLLSYKVFKYSEADGLQEMKKQMK